METSAHNICIQFIIRRHKISGNYAEWAVNKVKSIILNLCACAYYSLLGKNSLSCTEANIACDDSILFAFYYFFLLQANFTYEFGENITC